MGDVRKLETPDSSLTGSSWLFTGVSTWNKIFKSFGMMQMKPARIAKLVTGLGLKTRGCVFDSRAGQHNNYQLSFG